MHFGAGFVFGAAAMLFLAGGCFLAYKNWLQNYLTTNSEHVKIIETGEGSFAMIKLEFLP